MKVIDFVEYQLTQQAEAQERGLEVRLGGEILEQSLNSVCTATPEEAKQVVNYFVEDLLKLSSNGVGGRNDNGEIVYIPNICFEVPKEGDKIECAFLSSGANTIALPRYIDRESYDNIMSAISESQIFEISNRAYQSGNGSEVMFKTSLEKLNSYQTEAPKKL